MEQRAQERQALEQETYDAKAQPQAGKEPQPPQAGPRDVDQVDLTDEESRIVPLSGGDFGQCYNA